MAILNGLIQKMKGSAGQLTFKSLNGQTVVSEKPTKVSNPRTDMQQRQRTRWTNIIRMYKGLVPLLRNAFENKLATQNDNNSILPNYTSEACIHERCKQLRRCEQRVPPTKPNTKVNKR